MVRLNLTGVLLAVALGGCGGGGGGDGVATTPVAPQTYSAPVPSAGDYFTYKYTDTEYDAADSKALGANTSFDTVVMTAIQADGSYTRTDTFAVLNTQRHEQNLLGKGDIPAREGCTVAPAAWTEIPHTLTVGQAWDSSVTMTCKDNAQTLQASSKGTALAVEPVSVSAGTFTALKLAHTLSIKFADGTTVIDNTCWRDVASGAILKCNIKTTSTPSSQQSAVSIIRTEIELVNYVDAKSGRQKRGVETYAGTWTGSYSGADAGTCTVDISAAGVMSGSCFPGQGGTFAVNGTVDAQGNLAFKLSVNGVGSATFSGKLDSPLAMGGTWAAGAELSGAWNLNHY